jgi:hypothetical protein
MLKKRNPLIKKGIAFHFFNKINEKTIKGKKIRASVLINIVKEKMITAKIYRLFIKR